VAGIEREIAAPLEMSLLDAAWGVHAVANANMEQAMRVVSIERGRDPRQHALVAFGGAGPLHATRLARALGIPRVIVPAGAGVGSTLGLLAARHTADAELTRIVRLDPGAHDAIAAIFAALEQQVHERARLMAGHDVIQSRAASMHHVGQGFEIRVELPGDVVDARYVDAMREAFFARYRQEYGYVDRDTPIEVTDWYVVGTAGKAAAEPATRFRPAAPRPTASRPAYFPEAGGLISTPVIDRYALQSGGTLHGPALVEERECTTVVLPGDTLRVSERGNLIIDIGAPA